MQLTINTDQGISAADRRLLLAFLGAEETGSTPAQGSAPATEPDEASETEEAPKAAPRKRAAKKTAAPKPDPEPEPEPEDADEPEAEDEPTGPTKEDALTKAQEVMEAHDKAGIAAVKDVLSGLGLKRVGEMKDAQAGEFIELLEKAAAELDESPL